MSHVEISGAYTGFVPALRPGGLTAPTDGSRSAEQVTTYHRETHDAQLLVRRG